MTLKVTSETKAELDTEHGRVVGVLTDRLPGKILLTTGTGTARLTPGQARELAAWLNSAADEQDSNPRDAHRKAAQARAEFFAAEQQRLRDSLGIRR